MLDSERILVIDGFTAIVSRIFDEPVTVDFARAIWLLLVVLVTSAVHRHYTAPLYSLPSIHWSAGWSRSFILWQTYWGRRRFVLYDVHVSRAGQIFPVIRVAPNEV